jgi:hypothetical protein
MVSMITEGWHMTDKPIFVDEEVFRALQERAEPLVDDANAVLRRLLGLAKMQPNVVTLRSSDGPGATPRKSRGRASRRKVRPRAARGTLLAESEYEHPILAILSRHDGRAASSEVIDEVGTILSDRFTSADKEVLPSGEIRWRNRAQFVRLRLTETGDMVKGSPRGVWELSDQGRARLSRDEVTA